MSSSRLLELLENKQLSNVERSEHLRKEIISLYKQVDPENAAGPDINFEDVVALTNYIAENRDLNILTEVLALLRNTVPFNGTLRSKLFGSSQNETILLTVFGYPLTEAADQNVVIAYHRLLQYISNLITSEETAAQHFFRRLILRPEQPLLLVLDCKTRSALKVQHEKLVAVASNLLSRLLQDDSNWSAFLEFEHFVAFTDALIRRALQSSDSDAFTILKKIVADPRLFPIRYNELCVQSRSFLLDLIAEQLTETHPAAIVMSLSEESLRFCTRKVKDHIEKLRKKSDQDERDEEEVLFVKLITVLALSSLRDPRGIITNDLELLIMSVEFLNTVHSLGKEKSSGFATKTDFDSLAGNEPEIYNHPSFGLKRDLVRLIGNMCYKNKRNQDAVRDFNGVELLCDMSSLDARNPFITQWVVLALKNLMDNNEANQKIVASLTRRTEPE